MHSKKQRNGSNFWLMFIFQNSLDFSDQPLVFGPKLTQVHQILENGKHISYSVLFKLGEKSRRFGRISRIGSDPPAPPNERKIVEEFPCNQLQIGQRNRPPGNPRGNLTENLDEKSMMRINQINIFQMLCLHFQASNRSTSPQNNNTDRTTVTTTALMRSNGPDQITCMDYF